MKRIVALVAVFGLMFGAVTAAEAGKKKKKPVKSTLYFHGAETVGDLDTINNIGVAYSKMDTEKPSEDAPKSKQFTLWAGYPWNDCAGNFLTPVWQGAASGRIVGDMKITFYAAGAPTPVNVQVWPDLMSQQCASNDLSEGEYPQPAAQGQLTLMPGENTIVLKKVNFKARGFLTLQLLPEGPAAGRVLYDAKEFASRVEFKCIPTRGKTCS